MIRIIGLAMAVLGVLLFVVGVNESETVGSEISEFFTGEPGDEATWLMVGGGIAVVLGVILALLPGRRTVI